MDQLRTIMMTDIVGYTELNRQEKDIILAISQKHARMIGDTVSAAGGRLINIFGDSALVLFDVPLDAVRCAIAIQQESKKDPALPMRIALHSGDVVMEGDEVYGKAINLTSRILKVSRQGNVLCSDRLRNLLSGELRVPMKSAGVFNLKYVERPVEIFGLDHPDLTLPRVEPGDRQIALHASSVAVMPFVDLGASGEDFFLGEGISEAIIHALSKLEGINVISRSSSFAFSRSEKEIKEAGRLLGVAHVLEGSVQKHKNKIRITAQLIDTRSGFHLFSESYDKELQDLFSIQEEIAWLIAWRLKQEISPKEKVNLAIPRTSNTRAMEYHLHARHLMEYPGKEDILQAIDLFEKGINEDPGYVSLYSGICMCYTYLGALKYMDEEESYQKAEEYALRAIELDPGLPEAIVVHALSSFWINDWHLMRAQETIADALRIAPGSAGIRLFKGMFSLISGNKEDALIDILLANKLDPLNPSILSRLAYTYLCLEDFDQAHTYFRLSHNTAPFAMYINYMQAWSYLLQRQYNRAESVLREVDTSKDVYQSVIGTQGFLDAKLGRSEMAFEKIRLIKIRQEEGSMSFPNYNLTLIYAGLNRTDEMFSYLEKAFSEKPAHLMFIQSDPFWDPYRGDGRYIRMINRVFKRSVASGKIILHSETREKLKLQSDELLYIAAEDNYSRVVWTDGGRKKQKVLRGTLRQMEEQLSGMDIFRCHRSYLVNCARYRLEGDSRGYRLYSEADNEVIPVSRAYSKVIIDRMS